ncbi:tetratricopeptide repeat protein [Urechidicola sp. KH5]
MRLVVYIVALLFCVASYSQDTQALFEQANEQYRTEKYQDAIDSYHQIENLGWVSDALYFNLGNSYYKQNKVGPAIYYYEKALQLNPLHTDAQTNLIFANRLALDNIEPLPKTIGQKFADSIIYPLSFDIWAVLAVIASFLTVILFLLYYFSYSSRAKLLFFNTSILSAVLLVLSVVFAFKAYDYNLTTKHAVVFEKVTDIKNAPTLNADNVFKLHEGAKVEVVDAIDDWKKIKLVDGKEGWVIAAYIKEL